MRGTGYGTNLGARLRQAYIMAELQDAATNKTLPGFGRASAVLMNATGQRLPLRWAGAPEPPAPGASVRIRFSFRDAAIYALGSY